MNETEKVIPKEIEEAMRETLEIFVSAEWIEAAMFHARKPLKDAIAELESSATARALAAAAEEVGELFDLMRRDGIPLGNPDKQHVVGLILALTPREARLREEIRRKRIENQEIEWWFEKLQWWANQTKPHASNCECPFCIQRGRSIARYENSKAELSTLQAELANLKGGSINCRICGKDVPHMHVVDHKGSVLPDQAELTGLESK